MCKQLTAFLERNTACNQIINRFRARHSTETALLKVLSDIISAADRGEVTILGLLDMSAAFDMVDHDHRLKESFSSLAPFSTGCVVFFTEEHSLAARLVLRKRKFDPISDDLRERLHWLPIRQRIQYKLRLLVYKCLHGLAPSYLSDMLALVSSDPYSCHLRSAAHSDLTVPCWI